MLLSVSIGGRVGGMNSTDKAADADQVYWLGSTADAKDEGVAAAAGIEDGAQRAAHVGGPPPPPRAAEDAAPPTNLSQLDIS